MGKVIANHIERFEEGQLWLLRTGEIVCIKEVAPLTKIHSSDNSRRIEYFDVKKSEKKLSSGIIILESLRNYCSYDVDIEHVNEITYEMLNDMAISYLGKVISDKMDMIRRAYNDIIS